MARTRRVIRKLQLPEHRAFDDQLWPVLMALCVLTGFVAGSILAYLRFDDPVWYTNAGTWLVLTVLLSLGLAAALSRLDNRVFRRSMQLALLLGLFFHALLFMASVELQIFDRIQDVFLTQNDLTEQKQPVIVPDYVHKERREELRRDLQRPVETETPVPDPQRELVAREETPPEQPRVPERQPLPLADPEPTPRPSVLRREQPEEALPRHSEQLSQLSRRPTAAAPAAPSTRAQEVAVAPANAPAASLQASDSPLSRPQTPELPRRELSDEPSIREPRPDVRLARRADAPAPEIQDSATPVLPRQSPPAPPTVTPRAIAAQSESDAPAVSERTEQQELQPSTTVARQQITASPERTEPRAEPVPDTAATAADPPQRRRSPAEPRPELAQTPISVPSQQTRTTPRPEAASTARELAAASLPATADAPLAQATATPEDSATSAQAALAPSASTAVARAEPRPSTPDRSNVAIESPAGAASAATPQVRRAAAPQSTADAAAQPAAAPAPAVERVAAASPAPATSPAAAEVAAAASSAAGAASELAARPLEAPRQAASASAAAASQAASAPAPDPTAAGRPAAAEAQRAPRGVEAPQIARSDVTAPLRRESAESLPSATTVRADVPANLAPTQAPRDQPRPSAAAVARQAAANPAAARSQQALDAPAAASSLQIARADVPRASAAAPSLTSAAEPDRRPARAAVQSTLPASPANVESPSLAQAARGVGEPSATPARTAINKALTGTAGIGSGRNLDRAKPAADTPALVSSAAARRAEATQNTPRGSDLSPSAPAFVRRATAGQPLPAASRQAQPVELATAAGAARPSELSASASATLRRADANAVAGPVSAAAGTTEVDMGTTQTISEGQTGRASGGGQPVLNLETDAPQVARSDHAGGAPLAAIAASTVVDSPTAPAAVGGGQPPTPQTEMQPTAVARTDPGAAEPISGGPALAAAARAPTEISMAARTADAALSRAEVAEALPDQPRAGGGEEEDEEDQRRRLARAASQVAAAWSPAAAAEQVASPGSAGADQRQPALAADTAVARDAAAEAAAGAGAASQMASRGPETATAPGPLGQLASERAAQDAQPATGDAGSPAAPARRALSAELPAAALAAAAVSPGGAAADASAGDSSPTATSQETALARADTSGAPQATAGQAAAGDPDGGPGGQLLAAGQPVRAEQVEAAAGLPRLGGGSHTPQRAAQGPALAIDARAETQQIAGAADSAGLPGGSPLAAQGLQAQRLAAGVNTLPTAGPAAAAEGPVPVDTTAAGAAGTSIARRSTSPAADDGPLNAGPLQSGAPLERADRERLPASLLAAAPLDLPELSTGEDAVGQASLDHNLSRLADDLLVSRQSPESGLAVHLDAPLGAGGLGSELAADVGLNHRRASSDSLQVQARSARFVRQEIRGLPDFSTAAVVAAEPFQQRSERQPGEARGGGLGTPPPMTEEAIELGLAFLARCQQSDGSWSLQGLDDPPAALVSDTAATGLALLAFQGAGYNHREHKYADRVLAALQALIRTQKTNGDLFIPLDDESNRSVWIYSHSIAALALCEAYGMTQDPQLREPAQKAIDFLVASQHADRGGWRYSPQVGSDTSVTGWAMMALKSGELANLDVPAQAYDRIQAWLDRSQQSESQAFLYRYNPYAPDTTEQRHGRVASTSMTSVGLLMRLYLGWHRDDPNMIRGAQFLAQQLPAVGSVRDPQRDTYYWYYATQVMFHMGGDYWRAWNGRLHPLLVNSQVRQGPLAGSWDPRRPVADRWGPHAGRLYVTTMNLLSLEVYYRHLPLYEDTAR